MKLLSALLLLAGMQVCLPCVDASAHQEIALEAKEQKKQRRSLSDAQIRDILIKQSIAEYPGNCPCPYNRASNGSRCGRRSAYNREGGAQPLCYPKDVSAETVREYREAHPED